jgi:hypothetical protein
MGTALLDEPRAELSFYEADETGWLEAMAQHIAEGRFDEIDYPHLEEYLTDMSMRDRRETWSRLVILVAHWLKWEYQPDHRSKSWQLTIVNQQRELMKIFASNTLRNHARDQLDDVYHHAVAEAALETGLPNPAFPSVNPRSLEEWLALDFA